MFLKRRRGGSDFSAYSAANNGNYRPASLSAWILLCDVTHGDLYRESCVSVLAHRSL